MSMIILYFRPTFFEMMLDILANRTQRAMVAADAPVLMIFRKFYLFFIVFRAKKHIKPQNCMAVFAKLYDQNCMNLSEQIHKTV